MATLAALTFVALSINTAAWTTEDVNPGEGDYLSAFVYLSTPNYVKDEYVTSSYCSIPLGTLYHGYMSIPVSTFDDRTYVNSASFSFIARNSGVSEVTVRLLKYQVHDLDAKKTWNAIMAGEVIGFYTISTSLEYRRYDLTITGDALDMLRDNLAGDDDYICIGFERGSGTCDIYARYTNIMGTSRSYMRFEYDDTPPQVPSLTSPSEYSTGSTFTVNWSIVNDLPLGGNRGEVEYQVGVYYASSSVDMPYILSPWNDSLTWTLLDVQDSCTYYFRVRARDGSGFESNWSAPVNTTVDNSPPATPLLYPEPPYTRGSNNTIIWWPCPDAGVGNVSYEYEYSKEAGFPVNIRHFTNATFVNISDLHGTYYYRVRSIDGLGHLSPWSPVERSTQDSQPPSVPVLVAEPEFTPGMDNTVQWNPSRDLGSGVAFYVFECASSPDFGDTLRFTGTSSTTTATAKGLDDGITYYFRVRAVDALNQYSNWSSLVSSTQDVSGPSGITVLNPGKYLHGPITLRWTDAVDEGIGVGWYRVEWSPDPSFGSDISKLDHVMGQSIDFLWLNEGFWNFRVTAYDALGNAGDSNTTRTTVDRTPPSKPVLEELPEYTSVDRIVLSWNASVDGLSSIRSYTVVWREMTSGWKRSMEVGDQLRVVLYDLVDGVKYWFYIIASDWAGNIATSDKVSTIVDTKPPSAPGISTPSEFTSDTTMDFQLFPDELEEGLEYQVRWQEVHTGMILDWCYTGATEWTDYDLVTVMGLSDCTTYAFWAVARNARGLMSAPSERVRTTIDTRSPKLHLDPLGEDGPVSGTVVISGHVEEWNPLYWKVSMRRGGANSSLIPIASGAFPKDSRYFTVPWDTRGLDEGFYTIHVYVNDEAGWFDEEEVGVPVMNSRIEVNQRELFLSEPEPLEGEEVTLHIPIRNTGDVMTRNVSVDFWKDGVFAHFIPDLEIPARGEILVNFTFVAEDGQRIGIEVHPFSGPPFKVDYDVRTVSPEEEGTSPDSSPETWVGVLAIVLSVIAIALNLVDRRRRGGEARIGDEWVESREG